MSTQCVYISSGLLKKKTVQIFEMYWSWSSIYFLFLPIDFFFLFYYCNNMSNINTGFDNTNNYNVCKGQKKKETT